MTTTERPAGTPVLPPHLAANPMLSRWFHVLQDGSIHLRVGKVELGQGILTALGQVAAEELAVPLSQMCVLPANTRQGPDEGLTASSMSIAQSVPAVRVAAANVRQRFVVEAARRWGVDPESVTVSDGLLAVPDGRSTTYGDLCAHVDLDADADPSVRPAECVPRVIRGGAPRLDLPDKIAGRFLYIADLRPTGLLFGRVLRPPSPAARLVEIRATRSAADAKAHVVRDGSFVGVIADSEADADRALSNLERDAVWEQRDTLPDEDDLAAFLVAGPHDTISVVDDGPARADRLEAGTRMITARYSRPFLAHASMAPSCGIARWEGEDVMVWSHSQGIHRLRDAIAQALGIEREHVTVEHAQNAGCYGHNAADDAAFDAVLLAREFPGRAVQVRWSRADELTWAPFGSAMLVEVSATVTPDGRLSGWDYDVWSQGHTSRPGVAGLSGLLAAAVLANPLPTEAAQDPPVSAGGGAARNAVPLYDVGRRRITAHRLTQTPIRSSALRSLGAFMNVFSIECFLDELADATGQDPLELRLRHMSDPRAIEVLQLATEEAGWGSELPETVGRGLGFARYKDNGAYCAVVAEVEAESEIRLRRLTIAVDVGRVVNLDGVRNQIEGGAVQAASWTLKERVRFDRRRITSRDWESYPILQFTEVPPIDVHVVDRPETPPVGSGECAQGPTAAAIGNAVSAAVGIRVRDLPLTRDSVVAAIARAD